MPLNRIPLLHALADHTDGRPGRQCRGPPPEPFAKIPSALAIGERPDLGHRPERNQPWNGQLLRMRLQMQAQVGIAAVKGGGSFTLGDHRVAEQLRALGMDKASVRHLDATQGQAMLHLPGERLPL